MTAEQHHTAIAARMNQNAIQVLMADLAKALAELESVKAELEQAKAGTPPPRDT
jgi:hypothetical protein